MSALAPGSSESTAVHPLDPVSEREMAAAVAAVRADDRVGERLWFWGLTLDEQHARQHGARRATLVVVDSGEHRAWEVDLELADEKAMPTDWRPLDVRRPGISSEEARTAAAACREDPAFRAALARRGIHDVSLVMVDPESIGGFEPEDLAGRRIAWGSVWHRMNAQDNGYARPVQGVVPIIDLETMTVVRVEDEEPIPISTEQATYGAGDWGPERAGLRTLDVVQPDGPSFTMDGWAVAWQGWTLRLGFTHREGLVLHDLAFAGRSVLARASVNEMYVPYLDPSSTQYRKNFFDWGEYGAGPLTDSLALGCDCLGVIHYFDVPVLGGDGTPRTTKQAICMHEEDDGILWKHHNGRTGHTEVRRSRRLIISAVATVANYDYAFYWSLYQDGKIALEVKLTGLLSASGIAQDDDPAYGRRVAPNVQTPNHQHYFAVRLDPAVDGGLNRLVELHAEGEPDPDSDPYGNAVRTVATPIRSEREAARAKDASRGVHWRIESTDRANRYGDPTAYRLFVETTTRPFTRPESVSARRAPFTGKALWATVRDPGEQFVGGQYPNHAEPGSDGVHVWQRQDRSLDPAELVLWAILGEHHFPRPEDWPIMPVQSVRLRLEPDGFFDRNPALDVPAPHACATEVADAAEGPSCHCH